MTEHHRSRRTTLAGGFVLLLGVAFGISHVRHVLLMDGLLGTLLQAVVPLLLSVGIVGLGASVAAGRLIDDADATRFVAWVTAGVGLLLLVALWLLAHSFMMGQPPSMAFALSMNAATVGALLGIAVGTYDSQRQRSERAADRLDQFASIVAHDLRNPLSVAMGRLELAREDEAHDDEHLAIVDDALDQMDRLIDDVLALARSGDEVVELEPFALGPAVKAARDSAGAPTATIEVVDDLGRVEGDPNRVQQLLENLFQNAIEHAGSDVTVRVGRTHDGFYVEDDGPGIPPEDRERVFEHGYTTAASTGFGLTIVETVVEAHDWSVTISNSDGGGTRFEFGEVVYATGRSDGRGERAAVDASG